MYEEYLNHISEDVTEEIKEFVKNEVFGDSEYLFVTRVNKKNQGYCSKCNNEFYIQYAHHNEKDICPKCGANLTIKLSGYGRKSCRNEACFYYFEKSIIDPDVIVCKGYYVTKDYTLDYKKTKEIYELCAIYIFGDKESIMLKSNWGYSWEKRSSIFDFNQGWLAPKMCYCSYESIKKAIKGTRFEYIPYEIFQGHYSIVKLFKEYAKYPWIEQISKIGFEDIVKDKLEGHHMYNCLNYKGKDIYKILKLSRRDVKDIKESGEYISPLFLSLYQLQIKDKSRLTPSEIKYMEHYYGYNYGKLKNILKYTTMKKALRYMKKQHEKYKKNFYSRDSVVTTWSDYIDDCVNLGMDLGAENVLYPKDVHTAHQNTIKQIKIKENREHDLKIQNRLKTLQKYCFQYKNLIIRPAASTKELIDEGAALSHCVATHYIKGYVEGSTDLLVIRKENEPNKPYYTVEVKNNIIRQIHGKNNCLPNEEIEEFIEAFKREKLNNKKSKKKIPA